MLSESVRDFALEKLRPAAAAGRRRLRARPGAARAGQRARPDDGRRPRGARRRGGGALGGHLGADERGAGAGRHGHRRRLPRAGRGLDRAQPVGRRRSAGDLPAASSSARTSPPRRWPCSSRAPCSTRSSSTPARAQANGAASCSTASSRSSRAPRTPSCSSSPPSSRAAARRCSSSSPRPPGIGVEPEPAMGIRAAATGTADLRGRQAARGRAARRGRPGGLRRLRPARPARLVRARGRHRPGRARLRDPLRQRAPGVRRADRQPPGRRVHGRQHRDRARRDAARDLPRGRAASTRARASRARWRSRAGCARERGMAIGSDGVQLLGGHGYVKEHPVERWYRDLRAAGRDGGSAAGLMINLEIPKKFEHARHPGAPGRDRGLPRRTRASTTCAEHTYPKELDMLAAVIDGMNESRRARRRRAPAPSAAAQRRQRRHASDDGNRNGSNMASLLGLIELCWGDVGLLLTMPRQGLGQAAIAAVANEEQLRALRRQVGGDGDHRARGRLGLGGDPHDRDARRETTSTSSTARRSSSPPATAPS